MAYIRSNEEWQEKHDADMASLAKKHFEPVQKGRKPFRAELLAWLVAEKRKAWAKIPQEIGTAALATYDSITCVQRLARRINK